MIDEIAIQQTLNRYSEACSRTAWDEAAQTFTADGVWEIPVRDVKFEGRDAIRNGFAHFTAPMEYFVQINAPAVIQVDGDKATARSVIRECGKFKGRDEAMEVLGFYSDSLVRTKDGWRFARRVFEARGLQCFPLSAPPAF